MMPLQLWETTMDPERRLLKKLVVEDAAEANVVFSSLMGTRVSLKTHNHNFVFLNIYVKIIYPPSYVTSYKSIGDPRFRF